jgi:hypothetical protein
VKKKERTDGFECFSRFHVKLIIPSNQNNLLMRFLFTVLLGFFFFAALAQESPYTKFGKITPDALQTKLYSLDSSATAVVLSDIGSSEIAGNSKGWFSVYTTRHKVVHILNKAAYDEATVEIPLYVDGPDGEQLEEIKAVTYNLENGKVVESKLERSNVFTEKADKNHIVKKFTLPNVKEGSIIEYQYKVSSDYLNSVDPWTFQSDLPTLWSEFMFTVPQFYSYSFISHGYFKPFISENKERVNVPFNVRETRTAGTTQNLNFTSTVTDYRWVMKDVPELKAESFTSTLANHIAKLEFQLVSKNFPLTPESYRSSWTSLTKNLMEADYFAKDISGSNGWVSASVKTMTAGAASETEKARRIYQYVRDHIACTRFSGIGADQSPKNTFKNGKGTVAEVNLLLTAMLRNAGIKADPVILSTTNHGYTLEMYPLLSRFNYVVVKVQADGKDFYLDAAHSHLGFAKLLPECYNGHARVVNEEATPVYLMADSLRDKKLTVLFFSKGAKSLWEGTMNQTPGYFESYELRDRIKTDGEEKFFKDIEKAFGSDVKLANSRVDSLGNYDEPIAIHYNVNYNTEKEDILYINPMFGEGYKKNPFKSAERRYPVEMPFTTDETFILNMEIPEGYDVDELPKQIRAKFDEEGKTFFEYLVQNSGGMISLRSRVKIDRAFFEPDEYEGLREFFNLIVKKHNEQIVFKKKK